jgi:hypothetical protein
MKAATGAHGAAWMKGADHMAEAMGDTIKGTAQESMGGGARGARRGDQLLGEVTGAFGGTRDAGPEGQQEFFRVTDQVPRQVWYWAAVVSILISAVLKLMGKNHWAIFVGQWPPTFLLFGLYHKLLHPGAKR